MAIDFGRMARGVATGYLSAKIANTSREKTFIIILYQNFKREKRIERIHITKLVKYMVMM
jgi:hypothetical protein